MVLRSFDCGIMIPITSGYLIEFTAFSMLSLKFWLQWTKLTGQLTEFLTEPELDFLRLGNKGKGRMDLVKIFLG